MGKLENAGNQHFSPFSTTFCTLHKTNFYFYSHIFFDKHCPYVQTISIHKSSETNLRFFFEDIIDQDQTAKNLKSDLGSTLPDSLLHILVIGTLKL